MTHEKLLAEINEHINMSEEAAQVYKSPGWIKNTASLKALRAVVELHKPSSGGSNFCYACSFELEIPYPCPTVQAIEKELK